MSDDEKMQQNIDRTASKHALKQIHAIVEQENKNDAERARVLHWLLRFGWVLLILFAAILAHLMGVY
jgi:hypothetical protein